MSETCKLSRMDDPKDDKKHRMFTDAEINAAAGIVNTMITKSEWGGDDWIVDLYERLLDVTAKAKILLWRGIYHLPLDGGEVEQ